MSVLVTVKIMGDSEAFRRSLTERPDEYREIGERVRAAGGLRHQYGLGDGFGLIVDEWESSEAFRALFGQRDIQEFIASIGADASTAPEITIAEAVDSPDKY